MRPPLAPWVGAVAAPPAGEVLPWAELPWAELPCAELPWPELPWADVGGLAGGVPVCADPDVVGAGADAELSLPVEAPGVCVAAGGEAVAPLAGDDGLEEVWAKAIGAPRMSATSAAPCRKRVGFTAKSPKWDAMPTNRDSHGSA